MLIVVAIIAILVMVSIPLAASVLDKVRCATDAANERSARAIAAAKYLSGEITLSQEADKDDAVYLYAVNGGTGDLISREEGSFNPSAHSSAYGKCVKHGHDKKYLWVKVLEDGTVQLAWSQNAGGGLLDFPGMRNFAAPPNDCSGTDFVRRLTENKNLSKPVFGILSLCQPGL